MNLSKCFEQLGYIANKDFILQDDSDGRGPYIKWFHTDVQPTITQLELAQEQIDAEEIAKAQELQAALNALPPGVEKLLRLKGII